MESEYQDEGRSQMLPPVERRAIHQAGHAVAQAIFARGRYVVETVSLDGPCRADGEVPSFGQALLDREIFLSLYEFGLLTLAGIAAERRYQEECPPGEDDGLVAVSDLEIWQEAALDALESPERFRMVSGAIEDKLDELFSLDHVWWATVRLAESLVRKRSIEGEELQEVLSALTSHHDQLPEHSDAFREFHL